jgi:hypothetical protein
LIRRSFDHLIGARAVLADDHRLDEPAQGRQREASASLFLFVSEHGSPISVHGWQKLVERIGQHWNS